MAVFASRGSIRFFKLGRWPLASRQAAQVRLTLQPFNMSAISEIKKSWFCP
jgi:hypothetical protein